ncbi:hypothetical protein QBK99_22950 [Corticibacterium sp. UT-5YL-CI-8]|nr:hypothetical protein [Tianweitania sp. UT-5YL-CI-8]
MDHTSDPQAVRFTFDASRVDLAREFRDKTDGHYSADLHRLLMRMRWGPTAGRYVLVVEEPGRLWKLGQLPQDRGQKVRVFDIEFTSLANAEWHVFKLRWQELAGAPLVMD